jgi:ParB/RepB/Spo0J family partition protein
VTTVADHTSTTTTASDLVDAASGFAGQGSATIPGTDLVPAPPVAIGEIVDGSVQVTTGDQAPLPPIRAGILDARYLLDPQVFSRSQLGDMTDLIASVTERGVRVPLVVRAVGYWPGTEIEQFEVIQGKRRKYAAIAAERFDVPCWIAHSDDDVQLILDMLETNDHHKDLEPIEEASAYQLMLDFGWSEQQVADARRLTVDHVRTAVKARTLPAPAQRALNQGTLTSDQVQALEEFEDAPDERQKLLDELGDESRFKQTLARLREKRAYAKNKELTRARLVLDGVDVTPKPRGFGYEGTAVPADQLLDADGKPVDVETVKTLPGFHGFVEKNGANAVSVVYCDDPQAHGYTRKRATSSAHRGMSPEDIAAQEELARQREELLERLKLDAQVRREFLVATYGTAKGAKVLFLAALRTAALGKSLGRAADLNELYQALGGSADDVLATAGEDRLRRSLVAKYICNREYNLNALLQKHGSRYAYWLDEQAAIAWYDELRERGYSLSDDENAVYQELSAALAGPQDQDQEDDEQDDGVTDDSDEVNPQLLHDQDPELRHGDADVEMDPLVDDAENDNPHDLPRDDEFTNAA